MPRGKVRPADGPAPAVAAGVRPARRDALTPVGEQLRSERERRGIALENVAATTKIRVCYLEALERQDWTALPASVFTRGYLRSYAEHLGLDSEHLLRLHERQQRRTCDADPSGTHGENRDVRAILEQIARTRGVDTRPRRRRLFRIGVPLVGVAVVGAIVWVLLARPALRPADGPTAAVSSHAVPKVGDGPMVRQGREHPAPVEVPDLPAATKDADGVAAVDPTPARPASLPETEPAPPRAPSASHLTVSEFGVATGTDDATLAAGPLHFEEGSVLWFRAEVRGGHRGDTIRHLWHHGSRPVAVAAIDLGAERWLTESQLQLVRGSIGDWTVEVRDVAGHVLARVRFSCVSSAVEAEDR